MPDDLSRPRVGIVMGSDSDWPVMSAAGLALREFDVPFEADVVSAHRMPDAMISYGRTAHNRGLEVIIAGAGGAAHLPGMLASVTPLPVIGVPVPLKYLDGMDSLLSIVQMPAGVPVATVAIGNARNAGLLAVRILAASDPELRQQMINFQDQLRQAAEAKAATVRADSRPGRTGPGRRVRLMAGVVGELVVGAGLLVKGLTLITHRPRLFLLGAIPAVITSVIFTGLLVALITQLDPAVEWLTPFADGWTRGLATALRVLVGSALVAAAVLLMVISFTTLTLALGSPLYDKLSESVEQQFGDVPKLEENVARGLFRALRQAVALIAISALGALLLFAIGFVPVVGQTVVPVISAIFGGWMVGIELVGSAFERRGMLRLADRRAAMRRRRVRVLGFGVPTFLLLAIPFAGAVIFPIATAGGTLLARQLLGEPT